MSTRSVEARSISEAWLGGCAALLDAPGRETTHLMMRISEPLPEDPQTRAGADALISLAGMRPISEVRNTIFPAELAADLAEPAELAASYLEDYDTLRALGSPTGTYFGRICAYPNPGPGSVAQLAETVRKLRRARAGSHWRARYQINIYAGEKDLNKYRGFPCMAHLAYQLAGAQPPGRLDCLAVYRNQDLTEKGYGNLLGLAELQRYIAAACDFQAGELTVIAGHAVMPLPGRTREILEGLLGRG